MRTMRSRTTREILKGERTEGLAGRQGFALGARRFSKLVTARDFWF